MTRRILMVLGLLGLGLSTAAFADDSNSFNFNSFATDYIDVGWVPQALPAPGLGAGSAQDWSAIAGEFSVPADTQMTSLTVEAQILPFDNPPAQTTPVTFYLVQGDSSGPHLGNPALPVPSGDVVLSSTTLDLTSGTSAQDIQETFAFNYNLQPNTSYWIEGQGNGGASVININEGYSTPNVAQTPEPPIWMFFLALAGYPFLRRKAVSLKRT